MNERAAFIRADRTRQRRLPATAKQRHRMDASTVIERLEQMLRQPTLGPM